MKDFYKYLLIFNLRSELSVAYRTPMRNNLHRKCFAAGMDVGHSFIYSRTESWEHVI